MMRWVIQSSMKLRLMIVSAAAVLGYFGVTQLRNMPLDVVPEFSRPYVEVQTEALGLSAAEVEAMLTVPLEADLLNGVAWVDEIRSESIQGLSSIVMFFEPGTDLLVARQMVQERLLGIHALPNVSTPPRMLQPLSSTSRVLKIGLSSDTRSLIDLSVLARWTIVPRLSGVPGVANVSIWGQRRRQIQVQVDPARLAEADVSLHQIIESTGNALWVSPLSFLDASYPGTGGWIETPNQRLGIQHIASISTPDDLAAVAVAGTPYRLSDLADVVEDHQPLIGDALVEGAPALMLVVEKFPWANTIDVTRGVEEATAALSLGLPGVELDTSLYRPATFLELARGNLSRTLAVGAVLVVLVLLGLLLSWRSTLVTLLTVAVSALAAGGVLYARGTAVNMMLVAGLLVALAVLVDDAVIATQLVVRRLRESRDAGADRSAARVVADAILETRSPMIYATAILLVVVTPIFFLGGVNGTFSREIAISYTIAVLTSLGVALTAAPTFCLLLLRGQPGGPSPILSRVGEMLGALAARVGGSRALPVTAALAGAAVVTGLVVLPSDGPASHPQFRELDVIVELEAAPGTSEQSVRRSLARATRELRDIPGVRGVSAHLGRAVLSDRVENVDSGEFWVSIDPSADYSATVDAIRNVAAGYPGFDIDVDTYLSERMREAEDAEDGIVVRVYGENLDKVRGKAEEVRVVLDGIDGIEDAEVESPVLHPSLEIEVDIARAKEYGLKPGDIRRAATTVLGGIQVGSLFEEQKVFDVVLWGRPEARHSLTDVQGLLIDTPKGGHVRLDQVADLRIAASPKVIQRESVSQYVDVKADVSGRREAALVREVESRIREGVEFPLEYRAEVMGRFAERAEAQNRVRAATIAAAIVVLLLLQAAFGSWRLAVLATLSLPLAVVGGLAVAPAVGGLKSLGCLFGLLAVFGIATRNSLSLLGRYRELQRSEGGGVTADLVRRGTAERIAPVLVTALVTAAAVLPLVLFGNIAGHELLYPMAVFILGGLVTSTLVTLFVMPSLYLRHGGVGETLDLG